jgi:signal transduction histidine kinase
MKSLPFGLLERRLRTLAPRTVFILGLMYFLLVALIDHYLPTPLSMMLFHLLGVLFVGWGAGARNAIILAALSVSVVTFEEWKIFSHTSPAWILCWNAGSRFLVFVTGGWMAAEVSRLTRGLENLVAERTEQWKTEAEQHQKSEGRLRATINAAPIVLFAVDRDGIITFEDGQALRDLGFKQGQNMGKSAFQVFAAFPNVLENVRRALNGETFNSIVNLDGLFLDCWYLPNTEPDGTFSGFTGVATNITDRLRLERQILEISDREQARIGQDIHDGLCQQLVSLAFDANSLMDQLASDHSPEAAKAKKIAELLDRSITEARQVSRGLFPARLELDGLPSALDDLAQAINERFRIECLFESDPNITIPSAEAATHLYRIAQEAVNNAVKHSQARTILIRLFHEPQKIELRVEDDGSGLSETENGDYSGMGLHIMDYRARSIGAALRIASRPKGGTVVSCSLPGRN